MNGQSAAKLLNDFIKSYEERSTTMPRKGSRLKEFLAETPDIKVYPMFFKTPFKEKISCIYCILTEDKERLYIGSTTNIIKRMQRHREYLRKNKHHSKYLQRCYTKGIKLYYFVIENTKDLENREFYWIDYFNPVFNFCKDTKSIFRSKEFIEKYTIPSAKKTRKKIFMFNLKGQLIFTFKSLSEASEYLKTSRSNIRLSCISDTRTCKGYKFSYTNTYDYKIPKIGTQIKSHNKRLQKLCSKPIKRDDGKIYNSVSEAERLNNYTHNTLGYFIKNNKRRSDGHLYEYIV